MSVWTTKSLDRDRNYIVLQHPLKGVNYTVMGVKFREGYAVVEKGSKTYNTLLKMPIFKGAKEYPLIYLRKLRFIIKASDVNLVYGKDVFNQYNTLLQQELEKEQSEEQIRLELEHLDNGGCLFRVTSTNKTCAHQAVPNSPSQYCSMHVLLDPKLESVGIIVPKFIARDEKDKIKNKVLKQLEKLKVGNKNGENIREEPTKAE